MGRHAAPEPQFPDPFGGRRDDGPIQPAPSGPRILRSPRIDAASVATPAPPRPEPKPEPDEPEVIELPPLYALAGLAAALCAILVAALAPSLWTIGIALPVIAAGLAAFSARDSDDSIYVERRETGIRVYGAA